MEYYCPRDSERSLIVCYIGLNISYLNKVRIAFANMFFIIDQTEFTPRGNAFNPLLFIVSDGVRKAWFGFD